ncbi:ABC transporter ATP-binding protein [Candidatus Sumerlaeota bacterium]|nr:ABC transporter ATP-binding protein [Candidatus Sumerlaeota bacterium]
MSSNPVLRIQNLNYAYPGGQRALDGISFEVQRGETVGVIGANGAGKSTLLLHLNGILQPRGGTAGSAEVFGMTVEKKNLRSIRAKVGLVFQNPDDQLFCPTVYEDVAFGPRNLRLAEDEVDRRVRRALESVGMEGFGPRSPHHLSVGEKRRIAIATVLSMNAELLAFDEPTSNLDPKGRREMIALLQSLSKTNPPMTQIIVTHDLDLAREICGRLILLSQGKIAGEGAPDAILANESLLESCGL